MYINIGDSSISKPTAIVNQSRIHRTGTILSQMMEGRQGYHFKGLDATGADKWCYVVFWFSYVHHKKTQNTQTNTKRAPTN